MAPERFEDLLDAFERGEGDEEELARAFREQVVDDLAGAKRLLEEGQERRAQEQLDQVLRTARTLLASRRPQGSASPGRGSPDGERGAYRMVIADDNATRRSLHRTLLQEAGPFDVVAEADEARLLDAVRACAPDLVLLALADADEEGLADLPDLEQAAPEVQVAVLPAFAEEGFAASAREAGVDLCLDSEIGGAELVDQLRELVAGAGGR